MKQITREEMIRVLTDLSSMVEAVGTERNVLQFNLHRNGIIEVNEMEVMDCGAIGYGVAEGSVGYVVDQLILHRAERHVA